MVFSNLTCHLEDTGTGKKDERGSSNQEAFPSAGKNTRIVLVPCHAWKCVPTTISSGLDISEVPGCHLLPQISSQWGSQKLLQWLVFQELTAYLSVSNLLLTQWIMAILSKGCKLDNFESCKSLKLSFTNTWGLHSNFVECESFLESKSHDILALCEANLDESIGLAISLGYLPLIRKDSITYIHGLAFYVKEGFLFEWGSSENSADSSLCFWLALLYPVHYLFFLYQSSLCKIFDCISSNIDEVLSINPLQMCLSLEDLMSIIRTG